MIALELRQQSVVPNRDHVPLQRLPRAGRRTKFLMRKQILDDDVMSPNQHRNVPIQGVQLRDRRRLPVEITHAHHADVPGIMIFHVGTLVWQRSPFPDPAPRSTM